MIDATTHTRKIWRSHFDGADSTTMSLLTTTKEARSNLIRSMPRRCAELIRVRGGHTSY
jgi:hypothetical protein